MFRTSLRRIGVAGAILAATQAIGAVPAHAVGEDGVGNAGVASLPKSDGSTVVVGPLAACDVHGANSASSPNVTHLGVVRYGSSSTSCVQDHDAGMNVVDVRGSSFQLDAFVTSSRQKIRTGAYTAHCEGASTGSTSARFQIDSVRGVTVPSPIHDNETVWVNGTVYNAPAKAKVVFNEVRKPGDGSIELTAMHIYLYKPDDTPIGHAAIGTVACAAYL